MDNKDKLNFKLTLLLISCLITALIVLTYFLDKSLLWNAEKVFSCVFVSIWAFFIIPALRKAYLDNKDKSFEDWFKMGVRFGISGIALPVLFAPCYGIRYYLT